MRRDDTQEASMKSNGMGGYVSPNTRELERGLFWDSEGIIRLKLLTASLRGRPPVLLRSCLIFPCPFLGGGGERRLVSWWVEQSYTCYVAKTGLEIRILLSPLSRCWDHRLGLLCLAY